MTMIKKIVLVSLSIFCLVGCDYTSKKVARDTLKDTSGHSYLGSSLQLVYVENPGGMLSFGSNLSVKSRLIIFRYVVSFVLVSLFAFTILKKRISNYSLVALILIISGGVGNLIDRITNEGKVIDFIILGISGFRTGIFNIADIYITIGVIALIFSEVFIKNIPEKFLS